MSSVDLAHLINARRRNGAGSYRDMEKRALDAGWPISRTTLSDYANGKAAALPGEDVRHALAVAIGASFEEVTAAAIESVAPGADRTGRTSHGEAFVALTAGRTDEQIEHLLGVIRGVLQAWDSPPPASPPARDRE